MSPRHILTQTAKNLNLTIKNSVLFPRLIFAFCSYIEIRPNTAMRTEVSQVADVGNVVRPKYLSVREYSGYDNEYIKYLKG